MNIFACSALVALLFLTTIDQSQGTGTIIVGGGWNKRLTGTISNRIQPSTRAECSTSCVNEATCVAFAFRIDNCLLYSTMGSETKWRKGSYSVVVREAMNSPEELDEAYNIGNGMKPTDTPLSKSKTSSVYYCNHLCQSATGCTAFYFDGKQCLTYTAVTATSSASGTLYTVPITGCLGPSANNYDSNANADSGNCTYDNALSSMGGTMSPSSSSPPTYFDTDRSGCMDPTAFNYDSQAAFDDGSCVHCGAVAAFYPKTSYSIWKGYRIGRPRARNVDHCFRLVAAVEAAKSGQYVAHKGYCFLFSQPLSISGPEGTTGGPIGVQLRTAGCLNSTALNYDPDADLDPGCCSFPPPPDTSDPSPPTISGATVIEGCMDETAANFDSLANFDDGSCEFPGCIDTAATNYDADANRDDGSCAYAPEAPDPGLMCIVDETTGLCMTDGGGSGQVPMPGNPLSPPLNFVSWGDPHYHTFRRHAFDIHANGDLTLMKCVGDYGSVHVVSRMRVGGGRGYNVAFAIQYVNGTTGESTVVHMRSRDPSVRIDCTRMNMSSVLQPNMRAPVSPGVPILVSEDERTYVLPNGLEFHLDPRRHYLNIRARMLYAAEDSCDGVVGEWGNTTVVGIRSEEARSNYGQFLDAGGFDFMPMCLDPLPAQSQPPYIGTAPTDTTCTSTNMEVAARDCCHGVTDAVQRAECVTDVCALGLHRCQDVIGTMEKNVEFEEKSTNMSIALENVTDGSSSSSEYSDGEMCMNHVALGMESGAIPDSALGATSIHPHCSLTAGRKNSEGHYTWSNKGAWCGSGVTAGDRYTIDLGVPTVVSAVGTQARFDGLNTQFVTSYYFEYLVEYTWLRATVGGSEVIMGNTLTSDRNTEVINALDVPIFARLVRLVVVSFNGHPSMRMELYGCP